MGPRTPLMLAVLLASACPACEGKRSGSRPTGRVETQAPPPRPARPRPDTDPEEAIPAPPLRVDARVHPEELALLPPGAPLLVAGRPDLLDRLFDPQGWLAHHLGSLSGFGRLAAVAGKASETMGLDKRRYWVAALLQSPETERRRLEQAMEHQTKLSTPAGRTSPAWPPLCLRLRLVAALSEVSRTRAALAALHADLALQGIPDLRVADAASLPKPLAGLAKRGAVLVTFAEKVGLALAASIQGAHLVVDLVLAVAGPFDATVAAQLLSQPDPLPPSGGPSPRAPGRRPPGPASGSPPPLDDPFGRVSLLGGADLTLLVKAEALAEAALWLGMRQALLALSEARPEQQAELLRLAWRLARVPRTFALTQPRPFDRFALHLHMTERTPLLTLSWRMTPAGQRLLETLLPKLAGRDLGRGRRFIDELLRPVADSALKHLPAVEPWMDAGLTGRLYEGGPLTWAVILSEHWPRLLTHRAVRRSLLDQARKQLRPSRFVRRVNVGRRGDLLHLRLEGRPLSNAGVKAPRPRG